jgi:hypothetical protein
MTESSNIKVCVRVRPFNRREKTSSKKCIVKMYKNATILTNPSTLELPEDRQQRQVFTFDHSFWSITEGSESCPCVSQKDVYDQVGTYVLKNIFSGYNGCIMAYGQSGSGKTHTMMGSAEHPDEMGLIPRLCIELFERIQLAPNLKFNVELSYLEIYAEQIRDLINPENTKNLRVREHPETGPYVDGLTSIPVEDYYSVNQFILYGNKHRVTASTQLNDHSSRSHAIFILNVTQVDKTTDEILMKSKLCLVDLAGSERVKDSGVTGVQLQEAANINKSLTTLGRVINILAKAKESSTPFVPFRDSILTWLLKDTLGGNSKTVMIATISPSHINYDETLGTLQYAYRAKQIVNKVSVNAGKNEAMIENLRTELRALEERWKIIHETKFEEVKVVPMEQHFEAIQTSQSSWNDHVKKSQLQHSKSMASYQQHINTVLTDLQLPFLFYCGIQTEGPISIERKLIHHIPLGRKMGGDIHQNLHCDFVHDDEGVWVVPLDDSGTIFINGHPLADPQLLAHGDKITTNDPEVIYKFKIPICAIKSV